jgi:hypothetical protein
MVKKMPLKYCLQRIYINLRSDFVNNLESPVTI